MSNYEQSTQFMYKRSMWFDRYLSSTCVLESDEILNYLHTWLRFINVFCFAAIFNNSIIIYSKQKKNILTLN